MIAYFDTSAIVPLVIDEPGTEVARSHWLGADRLVTVRLARVEARAALAQARRGRRITETQHHAAVNELPDLFEQAELIDIDEALVARAGTVAEERALRAYDAVHLAAALTIDDPRLVVVAGDVAILEAAMAEGLATARTP